jgi:hypothetical protein
VPDFVIYLYLTDDTEINLARIKDAGKASKAGKGGYASDDSQGGRGGAGGVGAVAGRGKKALSVQDQMVSYVLSVRYVLRAAAVLCVRKDAGLVSAKADSGPFVLHQ